MKEGYKRTYLGKRRDHQSGRRVRQRQREKKITGTIHK